MSERAEARIDLAALRHNCGVLRDMLAPGVELCPVLKADGYGHGAPWCAEAMIASDVVESLPAALSSAAAHGGDGRVG